MSTEERDPITGTVNDRTRRFHYHEYGTSGAHHEHKHSEPDDAPGHRHPGTGMGPGCFDPTDDPADQPDTPDPRRHER